MGEEMSAKLKKVIETIGTVFMGGTMIIFMMVGLFTCTGTMKVARPQTSDFELGPIATPSGVATKYVDVARYTESWHSIPPPGEMQQNTRAVVEFLSPDMIAAACGRPASACAAPSLQRIKMPNPCAFASTDGYAAILCHEIGHLHGWEHPNENASREVANAVNALGWQVRSVVEYQRDILIEMYDQRYARRRK